MTEIFTREELARIIIDEAMTPAGIRILYVNRDYHIDVMRRVRRIFEPQARTYFPLGMMPPTEEDGEFTAAFCLSIIEDQLRGYTEEEFINHLRYWTIRMQVRVIKETDLISVSEEDEVDEMFLEELVQAEMDALGLPVPPKVEAIR